MLVFFLVKAVKSLKHYVSSSSASSRDIPDGSGGKFILVAYIRRYAGVLLVRRIM